MRGVFFFFLTNLSVAEIFTGFASRSIGKHAFLQPVSAPSGLWSWASSHAGASHQSHITVWVWPVEWVTAQNKMSHVSHTHTQDCES